ncbi:MAG: tRNA (adenosine(37)-N6)-threonylcarbamoyltransferase complex ATPase subunit type 1 TsaE, partial [Patescibacteria group bacterium]
MPITEITTNSSQETKKVGMELAAAIKKNRANPKRALVVALEGDLGSGKTTFIQGLAAGLGIKENVLSPTFVIQKDFPLSLKNYKNFYHIDAYRLKNPEELLELGFGDLIKNPENIVVIEWADKVRDILPKNVILIRFGSLGENKRKILISNI